ncbi:sigma-54-dependent Fis family transcriptional regulator [candidate division KSB1 bacterium]|nr:sigma-54-dependent Fis family transcriptional regulator [candidate division KSB1 bacterium]
MAKSKEKILIVDDEAYIIEGLTAILENEGYQIYSASNGLQAIKKLESKQIDLVLADLVMPGLDGLQLLNEMKSRNIFAEVIIITGKGTINSAVEAMKAGAYDYLTKPIEPARLRSIIPKVLEHHRLVMSNRKLEQLVRNLTRYEELIGQSTQMLEIYRMIDAVADSTANVIITGESGTGKELVARAIHKKSSRSTGPFIAINCAAFPREILENELFGHEAGAFTGALKEKPGCFELAHNGTLFLDELGEMSLETQAKILRVLEERRFRRLGGKKEISVDVRIIAATNRNLSQALSEKTLREDLYYRLCVVEIELPPLHERLGDIPLLATEFLNVFNEKNNKQIKGIAPKCMEILNSYAWPGNVRELKNVIERAVILSRSDQLDVADLPPRIVNTNQKTGYINFQLGTTMEMCEKEYILRTLEFVNQNKTRAAKVLGISLKTLHNKLNHYRLSS